MEVSFGRKMFLSAWEVWEKFFAKLNHIQKIRPDGLFRLNAHRYNGPALELNDGTPVRPGDLVAEIHLSSRDALLLQLKYNSRVKVAIAARKALMTRWGMTPMGTKLRFSTAYSVTRRPSPA